MQVIGSFQSLKDLHVVEPQFIVRVKLSHQFQSDFAHSHLNTLHHHPWDRPLSVSFLICTSRKESHSQAGPAGLRFKSKASASSESNFLGDSEDIAAPVTPIGQITARNAAQSWRANRKSSSNGFLSTHHFFALRPSGAKCWVSCIFTLDDFSWKIFWLSFSSSRDTFQAFIIRANR